jgi:4-amino-4-deoxy-L-arabinose transferase-like glycosyltransferase
LLSVAALCLWHRQVRWLVMIRFWRGFAIVLLLCLPWALLVSAATDGAFLSTAISGDLLAKVKSGQESHGASPGTYALVLAVLIWPATPLLIWAAGQVKAFTGRAETRFLLAWIVPFWVMIELIPTKLPHYPLPVLPALILLLIGGVAVLAKPADGTAKWRYYLGISLRYLGVAVGLVLALVVIWGAMRFGGETSRQALGFAFLGLLAAGLAAWFGHLWIRQALWRPFFGMIGAAMLFHMIVFSGVFPALSRLHISSAIAAKIGSFTTPPAAIATSGYQEPSLVFLLGRDLLLLDPREAALFLIEAPGGLAIIEQRHQAAFLDAASQLKLGLAAPVQLSGFNISKGHDVVILLYRTEIFDATVSKE